MSAEEKCVIEIFGSANQALREAIGPADEIARAGTISDLGWYTVHCEKCEADFAVGASKSLTFLKSTNRTEACDEVADASMGQWMMNLSPQWFTVELPKAPEPFDFPVQTGEIESREIELDHYGLDEVIDNGAQLIINTQKMKAKLHGPASAIYEEVVLGNEGQLAQLRTLLATITNLSAEDWQQIFESRAASLQEEQNTGQESA